MDPSPMHSSANFPTSPSAAPVRRRVTLRDLFALEERPSGSHSAGKSPIINPPYPWATNRRATVHSLEHLLANQISSIRGDVECKRCDQKYSVEFDLQEKFSEIRGFISAENSAMRRRAPEAWSSPSLLRCRFCKQENSVQPVLSEKKRSINWLFLLLGQMVRFCTLDQLKYFCKHTENHLTAGGAKDGVIYLVFLALCKQLDPNVVPTHENEMNQKNEDDDEKEKSTDNEKGEDEKLDEPTDNEKNEPTDDEEGDNSTDGQGNNNNGRLHRFLLVVSDSIRLTVGNSFPAMVDAFAEFGEVIIVATPDGMPFIDRFQVNQKIFTNEDKWTRYHSTGTFLFEELRSWATETVVFASADILSKIALVMSDDLAIKVAIKDPVGGNVIIWPAMPTHEWLSNAIQARIKELKNSDYIVMPRVKFEGSFDRIVHWVLG